MSGQPDADRRRVIAVVLSHDSMNTLVEAVDGIRSQTRPVDRLLVVDNASSDGTREYLQRSLPPRDLVLSTTNVGVGAGHWMGWTTALADGADLIWALEHDSVPEPDCLERLLFTYECFAQQDSVGAVAGPQQATDRTRRPIARAIHALHQPVRRFRGRRKHATQQAFYLPRFTFNGALLDAEAVDNLGPPRRDFFVDKEDREYSLRMQRAGYRIVRDPTATVRHLKRAHGGLESVTRTYYGTRNGVYLDRHVHNRPAAALRAWLRVGRASIRMLLLSRQRRAQLQAKVQGTIDGLRGRLGVRVYAFMHTADGRPGRTTGRSQPGTRAATPGGRRERRATDA